jgi:predicted TIM-barrel enzyme
VRRHGREQVLQLLTAQVAARRSLLAVGAASGQVARCAEQAGADLLVVYSAGYFRLNGLPSLVGHLPVGDANAIMLDLGRRSVIPATREVPVIGGVYGVDPTRDPRDLLASVQEAGFSGVINFPSVGRLDGRFRQELETAGLGFEREVELIRLARTQGLFTLAFVFDAEQAERMAHAGVDTLVGHVGLTAGGDVGSAAVIGMKAAISRLREIFAAGRSVRPDILMLSHGGPIVTPEDVRVVNERTGAVGFVAASNIERIPVETAITQACSRFKTLSVG